jgi:hypothetical protein
MSNGTEQRIFISYRRSDCQSQANGLHDGLRHRLDRSKIFMDIDSIPPGADFEEHIRQEIQQCDVVLVLIGDEWLDPRPGTEIRRLDEPNDFVRLEIESSLQTEHVRVIPVLVEGAQMPHADKLPESIQRLARLHAFELSDSRWTNDIERLTNQLREFGAPTTRPGASQPTMTFSDVDDDALEYALARMPATFKTKDLSEHPAVLATHTDVARLGNYHTIIGRYLMQHRDRFGLAQPGKPVDDRGSVWTKAGSQAPPPLQRSTHLSPGPAAVSGAHSQPRPSATQGPTPAPKAGWIMIALPVFTCGLASFVPPLWAASKRKYDRAFRKRMFTLAGVLASLMLIGFVMIGSSPTDQSGTPTGAVSDIGAGLILLVMTGGVIVAILYRNPTDEIPGAAEELSRRQLRVRYRNLVESDRSLAASMMVGRPDVPRDYDDGGLLDLNNLSAQALKSHGPLQGREADQIVEVRNHLGRFSDINEVLAYVDLPEGQVSRLRELAVFL